jgi:Dolichyl-phosphate-mannose-protein mannosyltransferase
MSGRQEESGKKQRSDGGRSVSSPFVPATWSVAFGLLALASGLLHLHMTGRVSLAWQRFAVDSRQIVPEQGHCFLVELGPRPWMSSEERPSPAQLWEEGALLGPANSVHADVRAKGSGRFSFWGRHLYFSSSDNTSPGTNGRRYEVRWPWPLAPWVPWLAYGLTAAVGVLCWRSWESTPESHVEREAWVRAIVRDPAAWALLIATVAWLIRLVAHSDMLQHPEAHLGTSMMGVPYSDAGEWDRLGENVARGEGLSGGWSGRRPFYALLLGGLYVWTGPSYTAAIHLNLLMSALTAAFVCLIGWAVFGPSVGIFAGLALALDQGSIEQTLGTMSETAGTMLSVVALYLLVSAVLRNNSGLAFWAGVVMALSNLTRTLTLIGLPAWAIAVAFLCRERGRSLRLNLRLPLLFLAGASITFCPWILRQYRVHGITSLSDNGMAALYAASTPKYGSWTSAVDREADDHGVPNDIKSRNEYFQAAFRKNLRDNPRFYFQNGLRSVRRDIEGLVQMAVPQRGETLALLLLLGMAGVSSLLRPGKLLIWVGAIALLCLTLPWLPPSLAFAGQVIGLALALALGRSVVVLLWIGLLAGVGMTAATGLGGDPRLLLMSQWLLVYGYPFLVLTALEALRSRLDEGGRQPRVTEDSWDPRAGIVGRRLRQLLTAVAWTLATLGMVSLVRLTYRTWISSARIPAPSPEALSISTRDAVLERAHALFPDLVPGPAEIASLPGYRTLRDGEPWEALHGRLVVMRGRIDRHRFFIPRGFVVEHYARMLHLKPYARTYFYLSGRTEDGTVGPDEAVISGGIPDGFLENDVVVVGLVDVDRAFPYEEALLYVLVAAPCNTAGNVELDRMLVASNPKHLRHLQELKEAGRRNP